MIESFKDKETEKIWNQIFSKHFPREIQRIALRKMVLLNQSTSLDDLRIPPSNRLEKLKDDRKGQYSIRINDQWRLCFSWREGNAFQVEIVDYH
jgi:proteic killer suppression protein